MTGAEFTQRVGGMMQTLYRVSYAHLARACDREDAVQECLRKAWEKKGQLHDDRYLQTWVVRILINECRAIGRKAQRAELPWVPHERTAPPDADAELHDALLALEERLRLPIILYYIEGYATAEIAHILRIPQGTVKTRLLRGRQLLRNLLAQEVPVR